MAKEKYSQVGYITVTESAANTLTFAGLTVFGAALSQKGMMLHRIEYVLNATTLTNIDAAGDAIFFGLSGDNSLTVIGLDDSSVYDYRRHQITHIGTAGDSHVYTQPVVSDLSGLPGGGKLVPADRIFAYVKGSSLASAATVEVRFDYSIIELAASDYLELAQSLRVLR